MSPRTEEQFNAIRTEKKQLILDAALKLFSEKGYENASISQIAKEAGISKGLVYNYFESKESLLVSILNLGIDEMLQLYDLDKDGVLDCSEMEYFITESFRLLTENTNYWKLYFNVAMQPVVFKILEMRMKEIVNTILRITTRYFDSLGFENPSAEALLFGATMDGVSLNYVMAPDHYPLQLIQNQLILKYCKKK